MYRIFCYALVLCLLLFSWSCSGNHCLKIGGTYQGVHGDIEYCFSQEKTEKNGFPTLQSGGTDNIILQESILEKILSKIEGFTIKEKKTLRERVEEALKE